MIKSAVCLLLLATVVCALPRGHHFGKMINNNNNGGERVRLHAQLASLVRLEDNTDVLKQKQIEAIAGAAVKPKGPVDTCANWWVVLTRWGWLGGCFCLYTSLSLCLCVCVCVCVCVCMCVCE